MAVSGAFPARARALRGSIRQPEGREGDTLIAVRRTFDDGTIRTLTPALNQPDLTVVIFRETCAREGERTMLRGSLIWENRKVGGQRLYRLIVALREGGEA